MHQVQIGVDHRELIVERPSYRSLVGATDLHHLAMRVWSRGAFARGGLAEIQKAATPLSGWLIGF